MAYRQYQCRLFALQYHFCSEYQPGTTYCFNPLKSTRESCQADKNAMMCDPRQTGNREQLLAVSKVAASTSSSSASSSSYPTSYAPVSRCSRASSPNTNVVVLPSGTSIHIKGTQGVCSSGFCLSVCPSVVQQ